MIMGWEKNTNLNSFIIIIALKKNLFLDMEVV